jgi:cold shock CspA family protein
VLHKKPQRAILDAFSEMRRRLQDYARKQLGSVKTTAEPLMSATVASLFPQEDHGFLMTSDGRQVYFHRGSVLNGHFDRLRVGSEVRFDEEEGEKGPQASTVHLVHPRQQARAAAATAVIAKRTPR